MKNLHKKDDSNYQYIIKFNKINLSAICRKLNINRVNIYKADAKLEDFKRVKEEIESELAKLYIKEERDLK